MFTVILLQLLPGRKRVFPESESFRRKVSERHQHLIESLICSAREVNRWKQPLRCLKKQNSCKNEPRESSEQASKNSKLEFPIWAEFEALQNDISYDSDSRQSFLPPQYVKAMADMYSKELLKFMSRKTEDL